MKKAKKPKLRHCELKGYEHLVHYSELKEGFWKCNDGKIRYLSCHIDDPGPGIGSVWWSLSGVTHHVTRNDKIYVKKFIGEKA